MLLRADLATVDLPARLAAAFSPDTTRCHVATYPRRAGDDSEFYVVSGPPGSTIWTAFQTAPR